MSWPSTWLEWSLFALGVYLGFACLLVGVTGLQGWIRRRCRQRSHRMESLLDGVSGADAEGGGAPSGEGLASSVGRLDAAELLVLARLWRRQGGAQHPTHPVGRAIRRRALAVLERDLWGGERYRALWTRRRLSDGLRTLGLLPGAESLPGLLSVSTVRDPELSVEALVALGRCAAVGEAAIVALASHCRRDGTPWDGPVVVAAAWALANVLRRHPQGATWLARDPSPVVRSLALRAAAEATKQADTPGPWLEVVRRGLRDAVVSVRATALLTLWEQGIDGADVGTLETAFEDPELPPEIAGCERQVANWAATAGVEGIRATVSLLVSKLTDPPPRRSGLIAGLLVHLVPGPPGASTLDLLENEADQSWPGSRCGLEALGYTRCPAAARLLLVGAGEEPVDLRRRCAESLVCLGRSLFPERLGASEVDQLLLWLESEADSTTTTALAEAAAYTAEERAVPILMSRMTSAPRALRGRLLEAMALLGFLQGTARGGGAPGAV